MIPFTLHRLKKIIKNAPNLLSGYNIYVDTDKLRLIDRIYKNIFPSARSFADLGGVWNVNAAYTLYTIRKHAIQHGILIDTNFPEGLQEKISVHRNLSIIQGDFANKETINRIGHIDVIYFFDVLLHQANPSWKEIIAQYAQHVSCFAIFNQQLIYGNKTIRLTDLPLNEYIKFAPKGRDELYRYVYSHAEEIHPEYKKPWKDIHNVFQWGITDTDLRTVMEDLGFHEMYFKNYGRFSNLPAFENHGFIFLK